MVIPENKTTKKLRIALCIGFLFEIFLLSFKYIEAFSDGKYKFFTGLDLIFKMALIDDSR